MYLAAGPTGGAYGSQTRWIWISKERGGDGKECSLREGRRFFPSQILKASAVTVMYRHVTVFLDIDTDAVESYVAEEIIEFLVNVEESVIDDE